MFNFISINPNISLEILGQFHKRLKFYRYFDSPNAKRKYKDQKFGFGGKKSGKKWNTKESYNDVSSFRAKVAHAKGVKGGKNVSHTLIKVY